MMDHVEEEVPEDALAERLAKGSIVDLLTANEDEFSMADNVNTIHALDLRTRLTNQNDPFLNVLVKHY